MVSSIAAVAHEQLLLVACTEAHVADLAVWASVRDTHTHMHKHMMRTIISNYATRDSIFSVSMP